MSSRHGASGAPAQSSHVRRKDGTAPPSVPPRPPASARRSRPARPVPQWLVEEQRRHRAGIKPSSADAAPHPPKQPAPSAAPPAAKHPMNGDYILVDLLDGAHVPTRAPVNPPSTMSTNSDSIISLPPVDTATSYFARKRAEAQRARKEGRSSSSIGSNFNNNLRVEPLIPPSSQERSNPVHPLSELRTSSQSSFSKFSQLPSAPTPHQSQALEEFEPASPPPPQRRKSGVFPPGTTPSSPFPSSSSLLQPQGTSKDRPLKASAAGGDRPPTRPADSFSNHPLHNPLGSARRSAGHTRHNSVRTSRDWQDDDVFSSVSTSSSVRRKRNEEPSFCPGEWGWRKPAEEDAVMPNAAWLYLALIGSLTFIVAFSVNFSVDFITLKVIHPSAAYAGTYLNSRNCEVAVLALLRAMALSFSFFLVLKLSPQFSAGSGIPEMKCVLSGVLITDMLNWRTLVAKMLGLVFSLSSGISIGRLGPFIHMSGITAALVASLPAFPTLRSNARYQLQALSAAIAAGVGATFGAPIGGTMLAVELMSTYYYIHWLPMALYCSISGYYFVVTLFKRGSIAFFATDVSIDLELHSILRLFTYIILGALCGLLGAALIRFTRQAFKFRRRYFKNTTPWRTTAMLASFAVVHTLISMNLGTLMQDGGRSSVQDLINGKFGQDVAGLTGVWSPFSAHLRHWNVASGLTIMLVVKFILTGLSLVLPVPAGTFMPIFEVGALLGRAFGEWCCGIPFITWVDPRATAIIGAAGLATGTLHTTSIAVVMLELTREAIDVLPLAVGVIVSYGVSKCITADLFSELIRIRKLPFILGLRDRYPAENLQFYQDVSSEVAGSFMNKSFPYVTPHSTRGEIYEMLTRGGTPWINCALLSDNDKRRLWGTVSRHTLWDIVMEDMKKTSEGSLERPEYGTFNMSESGAMRGLETVEFLHDFDPSVGHALVDMGPMQVSYHTPLWKVITFFRMLSLNTLYVMKDGEAVGTVTRMELIRHTVNVEEKARRKRRHEREAEEHRRRAEAMMADALRGSGEASMRSRPSFPDLSKAPLLTPDRGTGHHSRQNSIGRTRR